MQLPAVACGGCRGDEDADAEASVTFDYSTGGDPVEVTVPLPDPVGFVAPLHERECRAAQLAKAAGLAFTGFTPSAAGAPATLELDCPPTGAAAAVLSGIQTTNLLTFAQAAGDTADTYPLDLAVTAADTAPVVVSLPLVPLRCDPHAVQEDKRGTIFTLDVELDGDSGRDRARRARGPAREDPHLGRRVVRLRRLSARGQPVAERRSLSLSKRPTPRIGPFDKLRDRCSARVDQAG